ncbi:MAG TPA: hypothetical protein VJ951_03585, partial [Bacteroidales bacterium]|nr:hypothetical protein [Bacteroidales bacterium]
IAFFAVCLGLITNGCTEEPEIEKNYSNEDINLIGQRHNEGLDEVLKKFESSAIANKIHAKKSAGKGLSVQDKLELARFLDDKAKDFISENPLTQNGRKIDMDPIEFSDEQLLEFYNSDIDKELTTKLQQKYFDKLEELYFEYSDDGAIFSQEVDKKLARARIEIVDEDELMTVLTMGSVLKYSNNYWQTDLKYGGWASIVLSDATNGASAALWGLAAAGPLGAAVVGLNGAIIGSCTTYLIGEM